MSRREDEPYNPYPEETYGRGDGSPRGGHHHHHHFGHHGPEGGPYGSSLEHRPPSPPPPRPDYGDSAPHGYGEGGPYGHRAPGPYEEQRYEERRNPISQYPPGPYGAPAAPYPPGPNASGQLHLSIIPDLTFSLSSFPCR